ncbi:glutathione S-transferase family protein [Sphingomonas sp. 1P06PA]|uniref:glutathione S-transferase family protein n=1 Tax=Sphingomonas sp. 1P06PA TaxID=554121 RepID=UPI0039A48D16
MTAPLLILHHHDPSPFAEKIRLAFGIKRLAWASVQIPMIMPKPDLTALTGGYRGTPVLQIGADIYCDSRLIVDELERRFPEPALLRSGPLVNFGLQHWSDDALFPPGAALAMHEGAAAMPAELIAERSLYFTNLDFGHFAQDAAHFRQQMLAHIALIEAQLADGRAFLLGDAPEWADIGAYFPIWMLGGHVPSGGEMLTGKPRLAAWQARLAAFGTGERHEIGADDALAIARDAGLSPGDGAPVSVFPVAHPETAVAGQLVSIDDDRIVIRRSDDRAGVVAVHFPAIGYRVEPA